MSQAIPFHPRDLAVGDLVSFGLYPHETLTGDCSLRYTGISIGLILDMRVEKFDPSEFAEQTRESLSAQEDSCWTWITLLAKTKVVEMRTPFCYVRKIGENR